MTKKIKARPVKPLFEEMSAIKCEVHRDVRQIYPLTICGSSVTEGEAKTILKWLEKAVRFIEEERK